MQVIMYQANAFTDKLIEGSPTGIVPDASNLTDEDMKRIVKITNLNRIAFVTKLDSENYTVRIFTPEEEIIFCDCATVASFYALAERGYIKGVENGVVRVYQSTKVNKKPIDIYFENWKVDRVELYEERPMSLGYYDEVDELSSILRIDKEDIGMKFLNIKPEILFTGTKDLIIPVKNYKVLDKLDLNLENFKKEFKAKGLDKVHVFSIDDEEVIRYRNLEITSKEGCGIEDSNAGLIYYIKKNNLLINDNIMYKDKLFKNRHNYLHYEIIEDRENYPIKIGGRASIYLEGVVTFG